jgi:hypothetical protein
VKKRPLPGPIRAVIGHDVPVRGPLGAGLRDRTHRRHPAVAGTHLAMPRPRAQPIQHKSRLLQQESKEEIMTRLEIISALAALSLGLAGSAQAKPAWATSNGNSCRDGCHENVLSGRMEVTGQDTMLDLGTQLDGKVRGSLKTFIVEAGNTVTLMVDVLNGTEKFAVQLKRLEKSGQEVSLDNFLVWLENNTPENPWTRQEVTNPPYFTKDDGANGGLPAGEAGVFTFDLFVASGTPPDVYDLEFAVAGRSSGDGWYQDEHFYLEVLGPPTCEELWPEITVETIAKGQSPSQNPKLSHAVTGHVIGGAEALKDTAHRIKFCEGSSVTSMISDSTGGGTQLISASSGMNCESFGGMFSCSVDSLMETEKYKVRSEDGKDTDSITMIPN